MSPRVPRCRDAERQRFVEAFNIRFLRFTNEDIYENLQGVIEAIAVALRERLR
jgi:very-short-patch-repair endonuclease